MPSTAVHPLHVRDNREAKGVVHTTGDIRWELISPLPFDLKEDDTYCAPPTSGGTGHSYIVYGPLQNGATSLMYEGAPNFPEPDRLKLSSTATR